MRYTAYNQTFVDAVRVGGADANGQPAEHSVGDGGTTPCRSCLNHVPNAAPMLILAARPFPAPQPYAETGPIFLCADDCTPFAGKGVPPVLSSAPDYLLKAYCAENRIVYGTGQITPMADLEAYAEVLLKRPDVAYVDVRSARNNCFLTRIFRDD